MKKLNKKQWMWIAIAMLVVSLTTLVFLVGELGQREGWFDKENEYVVLPGQLNSNFPVIENNYFEQECLEEVDITVGDRTYSRCDKWLLTRYEGEIGE